MICPRAHSLEVAKLGFEDQQPGLRVQARNHPMTLPSLIYLVTQRSFMLPTE